MVIHNAGFSPIRYAGQDYPLHHLQPFKKSVPLSSTSQDKIIVRVKFHSHVFSIAPQTPPNHYIFKDEGGHDREFCPHRHSLSLNLKTQVTSLIDQNTPSWVSSDQNEKNHFAICDPPFENGEKYVVFFDIHPSKAERVHIEVYIKSAYLRLINFQRTGRRKKIISLFRECHYNQKRLP